MKIIIVSEPIFCISFDNLEVCLAIVKEIKKLAIIPEKAAIKKYK